jgi:hypothetical protein
MWTQRASTFCTPTFIFFTRLIVLRCLVISLKHTERACRNFIFFSTRNAPHLKRTLHHAITSTHTHIHEPVALFIALRCVRSGCVCTLIEWNAAAVHFNRAAPRRWCRGGFKVSGLAQHSPRCAQRAFIYALCLQA